MPAEYSESSRPLLVVDTASPRISVALGRAGEVLASTEAPSGRSSPDLLRQIDGLLNETGLELGDLAGAIGVRGPGSFTGLRVGMATLLGMHRGCSLPATAIPTFVGLAWQVRATPGPVLAVVDALRGEWFSQLFSTEGDRPVPLEEPRLRTVPEVGDSEAQTIIGFDLGALEDAASVQNRVEASVLAPSVLEWAAITEIDWNPYVLTEPLYLRAPATTPPKHRPKG